MKNHVFFSLKQIDPRKNAIRKQKKNAQIGKFSFFVKIPKSVFLALIRRFWYLMTLLDQGYQKTKKFGRKTLLGIFTKNENFPILPFGK